MEITMLRKSWIFIIMCSRKKLLQDLSLKKAMCIEQTLPRLAKTTWEFLLEQVIFIIEMGSGFVKLIVMIQVFFINQQHKIGIQWYISQ